MTLNLKGQRFGKLQAVAPILSPIGRRLWHCKCDCGQSTLCMSSNLKSGNTTSCGCARFKHGMAGTKIHHVWRTMLDRCNNPNATQYEDYGGRGIKVCAEWNDFTVFFADMGYPPKGGTIDRKDNDGPYCKSNCKWSDRREQARNKRTNRMLTAFGKTQTVTDWAIERGMQPRTLFNRLFRAKMSPEDALSAPLFAQQRKKRKA